MVVWVKWNTNGLEGSITHAFKVGNAILDVGMGREAIGDIMFFPSRWESNNITAKVELRVSNTFHGIKTFKILDEFSWVLGETHDIINVASNIFITTILETSKPKVRISSGWSKINAAKLGRQRFVKTCSGTTGTINRPNK